MKPSPKDFLITMLQVRGCTINELRYMAKVLGIGWVQVRRCRQDLPIRSVRTGFPSEVIGWALEEEPTNLERAKAELTLATWEYEIHIQRAETAQQRMEVLRKVAEVFRKHGGHV